MAHQSTPTPLPISCICKSLQWNKRTLEGMQDSIGLTGVSSAMRSF